MKELENLYLVNCGEWYSLKNGMDAEEVAQGALEEIFECKDLNISTTMIVLDARKCLRDFDISTNTYFFSTTELLRRGGRGDLATSLDCVYNNLYNNSKS